MEIDPSIQKALQLLLSRKSDSAEKLKQMLFESLGRQYVLPSTSKVIKLNKQVSEDSVESLEIDDEPNEMEADTDCSTEMGAASNEDIAVDADDFAFGLGISCVICRQFGYSSENKLLECQDCHNLYHQMCHKPAVSEEQMADDSKFTCYKCSSDASKKIKGSSSNEAPGEAIKKTEKKTEKSSSDNSKDKKLKSDKKTKERSGDKAKGESEKEKVKKHKSSDKESKSDSGSRKVKTSSKSGEVSKSSSSSGKTGNSSSSSSKDKHKQSSSSSGNELKHKRSEDKEKKAKKLKKEKSE
ncbi:INTS12 [Bugula neritina]|uniref:INTS12 n=1 Tax=Bugula neritina TaxID=10212 RepID=A0A7J7IUT4_BUGNE|nr:INTS12 [Bugula neritina]